MANWSHFGASGGELEPFCSVRNWSHFAASGIGAILERQAAGTRAYHSRSASWSISRTPLCTSSSTDAREITLW